MASGGGNSGKMLAGCGCLSVIVFLSISVLLNMLPGLSGGKVSPTELGFPWSGYASSVCCCLAGVIMVVGFVLIATGKKGDDD